MITFWQQENDKFVHKEKDNLDKDFHVWVDARNVNREDMHILENDFGIMQEDILDILDQDELARIDREDDYTLIIMRLPVFVPSADISYFTTPLGIILYKDMIITICWTDCEVLKDISSNRVKDIQLSDFPAFLTRILSRADSTFLRYLKEINRRSTTIQNELELAIKNDELIQLLNLQKSLVYFTTSLKSNQMLLEKISKTKYLFFDADDKEWLEDVEIDNRQALQMADTYSNILDGMVESFSSVISNNLNAVMKKLSVINLVMMVPTFITGFFGMNYPLPFEGLGHWATLIALMMCIVSIFGAYWIFNIDGTKKSRFKKLSTWKKLKKQRKQARLERKRIMKMEREAERKK
ncbi:MAG: magnesium transporter CorA family protein [Treponemataceae bacterium]|nr:magnesium transporter CorA family protein [Spirochaetales bacterium]MDY6030282.1 magnesium transporter CorA family protein [Treponemataceae bacterium]